MPALFKRIDTVFLKVNNFDKSIEWYSRILGFSVRWRDDKEGYAALDAGETPLTLVRNNEENEDSLNPKISFNYFYTSDIEGAYQHLLNNGVKAEPIVASGDVQGFKFGDLEGNPWKFAILKSK